MDNSNNAVQTGVPVEDVAAVFATKPQLLPGVKYDGPTFKYSPDQRDRMTIPEKFWGLLFYVMFLSQIALIFTLNGSVNHVHLQCADGGECPTEVTAMPLPKSR